MIMFVWYFSSITIIGPSFLTLFNVQGAPIASKVNNKNEVAVFGHLNPDTDAVATAIAYASFLKTMNINAKAYRLSDLNRETQYVLKMTGIKQPSLLPANISDGTEIALVDHNESQQSIKNLKRMKVTRVLDHHKLGDLTTDVPIYIRFEPVGCTATILAKLYFENKVKICQTTAMLMISAIISDTLFFRSATTTKDDRYVVRRLQPISKIKNLETYANELFKAKSDLTGYTIRQILLLDYKTYIFKDRTWGIGVAETWYPSYLLDRKDELLQEMALEKSQNKLAGILFSITDINNQKNLMLILGEPESTITQAVFNVTVMDGIADLGARLSRKLQIVPPLEAYISSIP